MELREKLMHIQQEMKVPKNLYNKFGDFNYRNAEGILEEFKKYEDKYKVSLIVADDMVSVADRIYVKAEVTLLDAESTEQMKVCAYAREATTKKGMDDSQLTGTASSYARKYALNGLFLLDDSKDADSNEFQFAEKKAEKEKQAETKRIALKREAIRMMCEKHGLDAEFVCQTNGYIFKDMTETQLENMMKSLESKFGQEKE